MISRRHFIGALAAGSTLLALPPRLLASPTSPARVVFFFTPQGGGQTDNFSEWASSTSPIGMGAPLARHSADIVVFQNLSRVSSTGGDQHLQGKGACLTNATSVDGNGIPSSESLDNFLARNVGQRATPAFPSLQLGVCAGQDLSGTMSFQQDGSPINIQTDPMKVYNSLFSNSSSNTGQSLLARRRAFVLGQASKDWARFQNILTSGTSGQASPYPGALASLTSRAGSTSTCTSPGAPATSGLNVTDGANSLVLSAAMRNLIVAAFSCDLTRVVSFVFSGAYSEYNGGLIAGNKGVNLDMHSLSHWLPASDDNVTSPSHQAPFLAAKAAMFEEIARLADALKAIPEGSGTMLDNTLLVHLTDITGFTNVTNYNHSGTSMPIFTIGGRNMGIKVGSYLNLPTLVSTDNGTGYPHGNLFRSIIKAMGLPEQTFGDPRYSNTTIPGYI